MTQPFLIFALPRSMTAWTSCFLTVGDVYCQHETRVPTQQIVKFMEDSPFNFTGIADPALLLRWRELTDALPNARLIYLRRPFHHSLRALSRAGGVEQAAMAAGFEGLNEEAEQFILQREPHIIDWQKLTTQAGALELWKAATGNMDVPATHVFKMLSLHIQQRQELIQSACANSGTITKN